MAKPPWNVAIHTAWALGIIISMISQWNINSPLGALGLFTILGALNVQEILLYRELGQGRTSDERQQAKKYGIKMALITIAVFAAGGGLMIANGMLPEAKSPMFPLVATIFMLMISSVLGLGFANRMKKSSR